MDNLCKGAIKEGNRISEVFCWNEDRLDREKLNSIKLELRQFKQENRARRKTIENELNMTTSFFKQQII